MKKEREHFNGKLIDCHTHSGGLDIYGYLKGQYPYSQNVKVLAAHLGENSIDHAITFSFSHTIFYDMGAYSKSFQFYPSGLCRFPFEIENRDLLNQNLISRFQISCLL
jgi:hypothetical protein